MEPTPKRNWRQFFSDNPALGFAGSVASLISIPLTIYFAFASVRRAELAYYIHPIRTPIVQAMGSDLAVTFKGSPVKSDLTAAQISIWNAGNDPIQAAEVLAPLSIETADKSQIFEVKVQKLSRDLTGFQVDDSGAPTGRISAAWRILEPGDGAILQVIYASSPKTELIVGAAVVGQPAPTRLKSTVESPKQNVSSVYKMAVLMIVVAMGLVILEWADPSKRHWYRRMVFTVAFVLLSWGIVMLIVAIKAPLPFGL